MTRFYLRYSDFIWLSHNGFPRAHRRTPGERQTFLESMRESSAPASPKVVSFSGRIVIYIWTRERRVRPKACGHINTFYRSRACCARPKNFARIVVRRCSVDGRALPQKFAVTFFPVRNFLRALYEIDELRKKYFIRRGALHRMR